MPATTSPPSSRTSNECVGALMITESNLAHVDIDAPGSSVSPEDNVVVVAQGGPQPSITTTTSTSIKGPRSIRALFHSTLTHLTLNFEELKQKSMKHKKKNIQSQAIASVDSQRSVPNSMLEFEANLSAREPSTCYSDAAIYAHSREVTPEPECQAPSDGTLLVLTDHGEKEEGTAGQNQDKEMKTTTVDELDAGENTADLNNVCLLDEGAKTVIIEDDSDQSRYVEAAKATGVKPRDFYYEMKRTNPLLYPASLPEMGSASSQSPDPSNPAHQSRSTSNQEASDVQPAVKIFIPHKCYIKFRIARALYHESNVSIPPEVPPIELLYMINLGWIKVAECDWPTARQMLGHDLLSFAQVQPEFRVGQSRGSRRPTEEEVGIHITSYSKPTKIQRGEGLLDNEEDRRQNGPFGISLLHLVDKATLEEIYKEIVRVDEEGEGAKENLDHIWSQRSGQCAAMLFKPILERMRTPYAPTSPLDSLPTELFDSQDEKDPNDDHLGQGAPADENMTGTSGSRGVKRTSPSDEMVESPPKEVLRPSSSRKRRKLNGNVGTPPAPSTSAPPPISAAAESSSAIRTLRSRTYRTDAPTVGKPRPRRRKAKPVASEAEANANSVSPSIANNVAFGTDSKGKKRCREEEVDSTPIEPPKKRPTGRRAKAVSSSTTAAGGIPGPKAEDEMVALADPVEAPTPEAQDEMILAADVPVAPIGPEVNVNFPIARQRGAPLGGLNRMRTFIDLGKPERR